MIPARYTRRRSTSTKNNTYSRVKPDRLDREEVRRQRPGSLRAKEIHPRAQDRSVRPQQPGPTDLPAQHRDLVPQREQLGGDRRIATGQRR